MIHQPLYRLVETTPPAIEPLTLDEVKTFLRVDQTSDDTLITSLITAARMFCESNTGRSLITRSYSLFLDRWPGAKFAHRFRPEHRRIPIALETSTVTLPYPPLLSVVQINIYAADNTSTVFDSGSYYVDTAGVPGRVVLTQGAVPPLSGRIANGIEIQFTAGYGDTEDSVPTLLRQGMLQVIAHLYEHRGDSPDQALLASGAAAIFPALQIDGFSMIADMKHRVTIQQPVLTTDNAGGFAESWENIATAPVVYAAIVPVASGGQLKYGQIETTATHQIVIRYRNDITTVLRLTDEDATTYSIISVTAQNGAKVYLEILAAVRSS